MDIYEVLTRLMVEVLAVSHGLLSHLVILPANCTGPLDPNATLTDAGTSLTWDMTAAALNAANILCDTFESLF